MATTYLGVNPYFEKQLARDMQASRARDRANEQRHPGTRLDNRLGVSLLHYDDRDKGYKFRRPHWDSDLFFTWDSRAGRYKYLNGFNVGDQVLDAMDLEKINLKPKSKKESKMKKNVNYIGTGYAVVEVTYELEECMDGFDPKTYFFKTDLPAIKVGDMVVIESGEGYGLCRVVRAPVEADMTTATIKMFNKAKAWVVSRVDTLKHEKRAAATERKAFLLSQLAERREAMEEVAIYKLLAEQDPDAKKLLEELENL